MKGFSKANYARMLLTVRSKLSPRGKAKFDSDFKKIRMGNWYSVVKK